MATRKPRQSKLTSELTTTQEVDATLPVRPKALVFVSHDSRDSDIAEAFANLLSDVSAGTLKSFRSSDKKGSTGIEFGAQWYTSIMSQLGDATDVVALLTARSVDRPWILYEAGVAKGKLEKTVLGLALGVPLAKVSTGPFGQFQNCGDDEDSLTKLVMQLLQRNPDAAPREEAVRMQVRLFIESLTKILATKPKEAPADGGGEEQNVAKLFEEIKAMVRELPDRVDDRVKVTSQRTGARGPRRFDQELVYNMLSRSSAIGGRGERAAGLLLVLAFAKDDTPWLYEVGMEIYRAMVTGDRALVATAHKEFQITMNVVTRGPWSHILYGDDERSFMLSRHLPGLIERTVVEYLGSFVIKRRPTKSTEKAADDEQA